MAELEEQLDVARQEAGRLRDALTRAQKAAGRRSHSPDVAVLAAQCQAREKEVREGGVWGAAIARTRTRQVTPTTLARPQISRLRRELASASAAVDAARAEAADVQALRQRLTLREAEVARLKSAAVAATRRERERERERERGRSASVDRCASPEEARAEAEALRARNAVLERTYAGMQARVRVRGDPSFVLLFTCERLAGGQVAPEARSCCQLHLTAIGLLSPAGTRAPDQGQAHRPRCRHKPRPWGIRSCPRFGRPCVRASEPREGPCLARDSGVLPPGRPRRLVQPPPLAPFHPRRV